MRGRVVIEGQVAWRGVEVDGAQDEVGERDAGCGFREEWEKGDEVGAVVVRLVVEDYAGLVGWARGKGWWWHGGW